MSLYSSLTQVLAPFAARLNGLLTGYDGTVYSTPGEAVRQQIADLHVLIGDEPGTAIQASAVAYGNSDVGTELTTVNGRLDQQQGNVDAGENLFRFVWKQGQIGTDGVTINSKTDTAKCYTENYIGGFSVDTTAHIILSVLDDTALAFNARVYNSEKAFVKTVGAMFGIVTLEAGYYYRFNLTYTGHEVAPSTADNMVKAYMYSAITTNKSAISDVSYEISKLKSLDVSPAYRNVSGVTKYTNKRFNDSIYVLLIDVANTTAIEFPAYPNTQYDCCGINIGTSTAYAVQFYDASGIKIGEVINATQETIDGEQYHTLFTTPAECVKVRYNQVTNSTYDSQKALLYKSLSDSIKASEYDLPDYYFADNYLPLRVEAVKDAIPLHGVVFAFITDFHFKSNQMHSLGLLKYIRDKAAVHTIISGGDYVVAYGESEEINTVESETDVLDNILKYASELYPDWFSLRGNHDLTIRTDASASTGYTCDDRVCYNALIRPMADWRYDVPVPETPFFSEENKIYANYNFVLTNEQHKVKIICFCEFNKTDTSTFWGTTGYITNTYCKYLAQLLLTCDGYTVIVATHAPLTTSLSGGTNTNLIKVIKAFANKESVTQGSYTFNFTSSTGVLACCISGHSHMDQSIVENGVLHINTTCDALYNNDPNTTRTAGTITEQAFDVVTVDTANRVIKTVRIGGGSDREFSY